MLTPIDARQTGSETLIRRVVERLPLRETATVPDLTAVAESVAAIISEVRRNGDRALFDYTERFDRFRPTASNVSVPRESWRRALDSLRPELRDALQVAHSRIQAFHERQRPSDWEIELGAGARLGQRHRPLSSVGIYVPGGKAFYPSSLLMNAIPARIAGVEQIVAVTPVRPERITPTILAAAELCGIDAIYTVGGAQAVAALAHGTETIPKVDKIVGPGNIYVATAKQQLFGVVDIDMIAGPSEVLIVADSETNVRHLAADMLAQAEHDERAIAGVVCCDEALFGPLCQELERQLSTLPRRSIAESSLRDFGYFVTTSSTEESLALANRIAPEHLELALRDAERWLDQVRFAGCVFVGAHSAEALGDYCAGPNHVLPTGGSARFFSPLGVYDFFTRVNVVQLDAAIFRELAPHVVELARDECLEAHARSVTIRLEE